MEINITELSTSKAKHILDTFRRAELCITDAENNIASVVVPEVLIMKATDVIIPDVERTGHTCLRPGVKICTHDDAYELADIDYGVIKIL